MVIVAVNPCEAQALSMALALVLANFVFLKRHDIRIEIEYRRPYTIACHPLNNSRRTWRTTRMEQHFCCAFRYFNRTFLVFHGLLHLAMV